MLIPRRMVLRRRPYAPAQAFFSSELGEFILPYDAVRTAGPTPSGCCWNFFRAPMRRRRRRESGDRANLECAPGELGIPTAGAQTMTGSDRHQAILGSA